MVRAATLLLVLALLAEGCTRTQSAVPSEPMGTVVSAPVGSISKPNRELPPL